MTFKFPCPHCGQRVAATDELIGQNVVCPTCSQNFVVHSPADLPIVEMSSVNSAPTKTHGRTPPYLWAICGTVFVLMISGGLYFWSSKKWISTSPHSASRELQKPTPNLPDLGGNQPSLIPGIPSSPEPVTPPFNGIPGLPDAPDQPAPPPAPPLHNAAGEIIFPIPESTDAAVQAKLSKIIFPGVDFRDTPLSECVDFLNHKSKELDPQRVGVSVAIDHSVPPSTTGFRLTLRLNNVPEVEVLNYVASLCGLKFRIDASGVTLLPKIDTKTGVLFQAAAEGNAIAQDKLGMMYVTGKGVPKDDAKAFEWFQKAAAQGYALAQYDLGYMYAAGRGVPKDDAKAFEWYQKAAAQGNASAQNFLGVMYASGQGVPKDDTKAFEWYLKAAEQGNSDAKNELGLIYLEGKGVSEDDARAFVCFQNAAAQGNPLVQYNLAFVYGTGKGVPKNDTQSFEWCQKAAVQGNAPAQYYLGLMYVNGQGVGKDEAKALESFQKATAQGNPEAKEWVRNYTAGSKPKPSLK